jgi:hypothetical protein
VLKQRVNDTKDETDKAKVDTDRVQKLNDKICKCEVEAIWLGIIAERNQESIREVK